MDGRIRGAIQPVDLTPAASGYLDVVRFLAAIAVMCGHLRGLYFVDYEHLAPPVATFPVKAIYFLTGFGHQAVMAFFVLSGLFISSSVVRHLQRASWSWQDYAIDRGVRLYLVLVPGLLLGGVLDIAGVRFFNHTGIYSTPLPAFGSGIPAQQLNLLSFVGSLLFLQTRFTTVFGSNGPLWSLFNEFWYYVLFPILIAVILSARRRSFMAAVYFVLAILVAWILAGALIGFIVWLAGGGVSLTSRYFRFGKSGVRSALTYSLCAAAVVGVCLFSAREHHGWLGSDLAVGLTFALLVHGIIQIRMPFGPVGLRIAKECAAFSYSLYILHFPLLLIIRAKWALTSSWQPNGFHLLLGAGIASSVLFYAFAIAQITEKKTSAIRSWLRCQLSAASR